MIYVKSNYINKLIPTINTFDNSRLFRLFKKFLNFLKKSKINYQIQTNNFVKTKINVINKSTVLITASDGSEVKLNNSYINFVGDLDFFKKRLVNFLLIIKASFQLCTNKKKAIFLLFLNIKNLLLMIIVFFIFRKQKFIFNILMP